ncbi:HesA/MoeB/ThiF family protein [Mangrovicoccus algicola]|uniref:Molybdopterin-synthase adenylyltransferase n=1 Tax=Mangrovicoccus algicola TaxID=2771008 RepID=A0A8J6Z5G6_9RHOB|nr:molybdopterin-synthase adenylyltransferase MoeB [Mangrovicoccus algicola]MBE3636650.1 molybdopterin-synthase adenylyltransferase MoeB [Mangrovicoccus algicola]
MIPFALGAAAIWLAGRAAGLPGNARWLMIGLLYLLCVALLILLPPGTALRRMLGGPPEAWLFLGACALLVAGYAKGLALLRARHRRDAGPVPRPQSAPIPAPAPQSAPEPEPDSFDPEAPMSDAELDRYMRHILLREIGGPGQTAFRRARVLVIGAGGLGAPALQYLAAAGIGTIGVIDDDVVDVSNLHRQIIHATDRTGMPKVFSAQAALRALNPHIRIRPYHRRLDTQTAREVFAQYDLVLDGTDNFATRYLVNRTCTELAVPLISGAITQWEGQLSLFDPARGGPCYECVFPEAPAPGLVPSCAEAGVIGPLPGVIGTMMAVEALKHVAGAGRTLRGEMILYDGLWGETRTLRLSPRPDCPCCDGRGA